MGSAFYTYDQAAARLGRTKRTIQMYVKRGLVRKRYVDGKTLLEKDDIEHLILDRDCITPAFTRKTFMDMVTRVKHLEESMSLVKQLLDIHNDPLRPDTVQARSLYAAADQAANFHGGWSPQEITLWANTFAQIDETTLEAISNAVANPNPWKPFFALCEKLDNYTRQQFTMGQTLELQKLIALVQDARRRLRQVVVTWIESGRGTTSEVILRALDSPKEELTRRLFPKANRVSPKM